jgi:hypothetical protein
MSLFDCEIDILFPTAKHAAMSMRVLQVDREIDSRTSKSFMVLPKASSPAFASSSNHNNNNNNSMSTTSAPTSSSPLVPVANVDEVVGDEESKCILRVYVRIY